jgi:hypothetical protein
MAKRKVQDSYDATDKALAVAIMASPASDKKTTTGVAIQSLIDDVNSLMSHIGVSFKELRNRLQSWANRHWGSLSNNIFTLTKIGRQRLRRIAAAA